MARAVTVEPRLGGAVCETMFDAAGDAWGEVLEWAPGRRFARSWQPGNSKDRPTRVAVDFEDIGAGHRRVRLTHTGWEICGAGAAGMRDGCNDGWDLVFVRLYARALA